MKISRSTPRPNGTTRLFIELEPGEEIFAVKAGQQFAIAAPGEKLIRIHPDRHYSLGQPLQDDVMGGHILADATEVHWCSVEQKWVS